MAAAFGLSQLAALPDALLALWLMLLGKGVLTHRPGLVQGAAIGLGVSTAATWFLRTVSTRVQRRFRDRVTIALESHVAQLQASVATIAHQERPEYLDRLSMLRNQVFVLDHMYMSLFSTLGWILRLGVTMALLASIHPALMLLVVFARADRADFDVAARRRAIRAGARRASQSPGASPVHHRHDRAAREGSARHRDRRAADGGAPRGVGALVRAGGERPLGLGAVARAGLGGVRLRVCRRGGVRIVRPARSGERGAAGAGGGCAAVGVHRRYRRRDRISARLLDGRLAAAGMARGLRRLGRRVGRSAGSRTACGTASGSSTCRSPIRARRAWCWTMCR